MPKIKLALTRSTSAIKKRLRRFLKIVAEWCRTHRHDAVDKQQAILNAKLRCHYQYYGRPTNYRSLRQYLSGGPEDLEEVACAENAGTA